MINVAFCINDSYAQYIAVCIKSICVNNVDSKVRIFVLTDYISQKNKKNLYSALNGSDNVHLDIYKVDHSELIGLKDTWSIYTWYRVLIPKVLPENISRVLYLDADTLVLGNLCDLFSFNMDNNPIASVIDIESFNCETRTRCLLSQNDIYICAGVMVMNLDYWRKHNLSQEIIRWGRENNNLIKFPDQDTINVLCRNNKIVLPIRYGIQEVFYTKKTLVENGYQTELIDALDRPVIVHFAGCAPWIKEFDFHMYNHEWKKYNRMLKSHAKTIYKTKGLNGLKVRIYRLFHPLKANSITEMSKKLKVHI